VNGSDFMDGWFQNVPELVSRIDEFYTAVEQKHGPEQAKFAVSARKIVRLRHWEESYFLFRDHLDRVLRELNVFYCPSNFGPGPAILFPQQDVCGNYFRARMKPMYDLVLKGEPAKYTGLGRKAEWIGPNWLGNSDYIMQRMLDERMVILPEGMFDILACRLLCPDLPILASGTDRLGADHIAWLKMAGVEQVAVLFDAERDPDGKPGPGVVAAGITQRVLGKEGILVRLLECPAKDPSRCLESATTALRLQSLLNSLF
jgi:hypothetical protein